MAVLQSDRIELHPQVDENGKLIFVDQHGRKLAGVYGFKMVGGDMNQRCASAEIHVDFFNCGKKYNC